MGYLSNKFKNEGVPFMDGAEKGELKELFNKPLILKDFGFINDSNANKKFAVMQFEGFDNKFYFGGQVISEQLQECMNDLNDKSAVLEEYAKCYITFVEKISKSNGRKYVSVEYNDR